MSTSSRRSTRAQETGLWIPDGRGTRVLLNRYCPAAPQREIGPWLRLRRPVFESIQVWGTRLGTRLRILGVRSSNLFGRANHIRYLERFYPLIPGQLAEQGTQPGTQARLTEHAGLPATVVRRVI